MRYLIFAKITCLFSVTIDTPYSMEVHNVISIFSKTSFLLLVNLYFTIGQLVNWSVVFGQHLGVSLQSDTQYIG